MMPIQSIESPPAHENEVTSNGQKPKTLPCRYCQKRFRRLEHVQRHERTHTKEKPFRCGCGKNFGRRDLLVRHEKLVHSHESSKDARNNSTASANVQMSPPSVITAPNLIDPDLLIAQTQHYSNVDLNAGRTQETMMHHRTPGCSLDLLSDAANHLASSDMHMTPSMPPMQLENRGHQEPMHYGNTISEQAPMRNSRYSAMPPNGPIEDYNFFLDDSGMSNYFLPSSAFDPELPVSWGSRPDLQQQNSGGDYHLRPPQQEVPQDDNNSFSRFGSRLPSLQPEFHDPSDGSGRGQEDASRSGPPWRISGQDHREIQIKLDDFASVLPKGFVLPSRHTLSRFLEGYINGFHEHLPFLHIPTIRAVNLAPELLLALVAVGAQYRFESHRGNGLWYAARAIAVEQVRRRNSQQVLDILSPSTYGSESAVVSPVSGYRHMENSGRHDSRGTLDGTEIVQNDPRSRASQARLETIQALLLLMAMGTWAPRALLREALSLQSQLALLVREQGLYEMHITHPDISWDDWVRIEGDKRTKFITYCFFNLHCIAYDMPPLLLTSEITMNLPHSTKEWKAETAQQWREARRSTPPQEVAFRDVLGKLFARPPIPGNHPPISSLGNYILIHSLVQQIFFVRQTSTMNSPGTCHNSLRPHDIDELGQALRLWQSGWERTPDSSLDPSNPYGPVAFNSTALLRLAYIRLHSDLGPYRRLDTRDPVRIAAALKGSPPLIRSPRLSRAVLQSAHALSIPVKIGINFVARTQTFSWSIQHSLCNLECAFLLSKWLETIAMSSMMDLTQDERNLLEMVRSMLDETEFAVSFNQHDSASTFDQRAKIKQLGAAVVRLWAETFKGTHIFAIVRVIGSSLDIYADLLEKANDAPDG